MLVMWIVLLIYYNGLVYYMVNASVISGLKVV